MYVLVLPRCTFNPSNISSSHGRVRSRRPKTRGRSKLILGRLLSSSSSSLSSELGAVGAALGAAVGAVGGGVQ